MPEIVCKITDPGRFTEGRSYKIDYQYDKVIVVADDSTVISKMMHHINTNGDYFRKHFGGGN